MWRTASLVLLVVGFVSSTPLDDYVWKYDPHYKYEVLHDLTYKSPGVTSYTLNMTSQRWLTDEDVDRSIWFHYLSIHIPDQFDPQMKSHGMMLIDGGGNSPNPPDNTDTFIEFMRLLAVSTGSVTGCLKQIPNEHIMFKKDPLHASRTEDGIIAYTWRHFIEHPDEPEWLLRMPMTKAAVRGMDTITDFVNKTVGVEVPYFCVGGASKRGWTTWTTAAVDFKRVKCITPIVMDELNMVKNLHHHYRAYGGWSFAMEDYYNENVTMQLDNPNTQKMAEIVDGYYYRDRLTMPKMVFSTGGDEFFLPDDSHYYFQDMLGMKYVNMLPNAEHSCAGHEMQLLFNIRSFYLSVVKGEELPQAIWTIGKSDNGGYINVTTTHKPLMIRSWHATTISTKRRDFRFLMKGANGEPAPQPNLWSHAEVEKYNDFNYGYSMDKPALGGWRIFFIQMTFSRPDGSTFEFTTETNVIPDTFPFADCTGTACKGVLV